MSPWPDGTNLRPARSCDRNIVHGILAVHRCGATGRETSSNGRHLAHVPTHWWISAYLINEYYYQKFNWWNFIILNHRKVQNNSFKHPKWFLSYVSYVLMFAGFASSSPALETILTGKEWSSLLLPHFNRAEPLAYEQLGTSSIYLKSAISLTN